MGCVSSKDGDADSVPSNKGYFLSAQHSATPASPTSPAGGGGSRTNNNNSSNNNRADNYLAGAGGDIRRHRNEEEDESAPLNNSNNKTNKSSTSNNHPSAFDSRQQEKPKPRSVEEIEQLLGRPVPVHLNVYNLQRLDPGKKKSLNGQIGFGVFHSGVQIFNYEFSFGGAPGAPPNTPGIFPSQPRACLPPDQFHKQILMGNIYGGATLEDVRKVLLKMNPDWLAASYHLLAKNCNHFAEAFLKELSDEFHVAPVMAPPPYINRAARWGDVVIPEKLYNYFMDQVPQAPENNKDNKTSNNNNNNDTPPPPSFTPQAPRTNSHNGNNYNNNNRHNASFEDEEDILAAIPIPTRPEMNIMSVKEIKTVMWVHGISWDGCLEKNEIIERVEEFSRRNQGGSSVQQSFMNNNNNRGSATTSTGSSVVNTNNNNNNNNQQQQREIIMKVDDKAVETIMAMGFDCPKSKVEDALKKTNNNIDRAVEIILES